MRQVPKKNIDRIIADIKKPALISPHSNLSKSHFNRLEEKDQPVLVQPQNKPGSFILRQKKSKRFAGLVVLAVLIFFTATVFVTANYFLPDFKKNLMDRGLSVWDNFESAKKALLSFKPEKAALFFEANNMTLNGLEENFSFAGFLEKVSPVFQNSFGLLKQVSSLNSSALGLVNDLAILKTDGLKFLFSGNGQQLVKILEDFKSKLNEINSGLGAARNQISGLKDFSSELAQ